MNLYLGLDSSTQSLSAIVIAVGPDDERHVVFEHTLNFDAEYPEYGTQNGVLPHDDPTVQNSSPLLWVAALDRMMGIIAKESDLDLASLRAIAGSGQQHGSVYLKSGVWETLRGLDPQKDLVAQLGDVFSRRNSPIWMDASTTAQCEAIRAAVGGDSVLAELTGSGAFERFTGPQIRKFYETEPDAYASTHTIHLVSSFMASLLAGESAPIDPGDGAGMNLMDLGKKRWALAALKATAPGLEAKLPPVAESCSLVGKLSPYWAQRYGLSSDIDVAMWSGDNPCSLIGVGLVKPGRIAISLGTSDTLFGFLPEPVVDTEGRGHVFGAPTGDYMSLICFLNGSLAREQIRDAAGYDWQGFEAALNSTPVGNNGAMLLPWFAPEITPRVEQPGVHRFDLAADDHPANVRAVIEAQMIATTLHSEWMGVEVDTIYATGGASRNRGILQVMSDVHNARVYQLETGNSAALGAALRAYHAHFVANGQPMEWDDVTRGFVTLLAGSEISPVRAHVDVYREMKNLYAQREAHARHSE